jgi:hypothetical protein
VRAALLILTTRGFLRPVGEAEERRSHMPAIVPD